MSNPSPSSPTSEGREVKRWHLLDDEPWMERSATGKWVQFGDFARISASLTAVQAEIVQLKAENEKLKEKCIDLRQQLEEYI